MSDREVILTEGDIVGLHGRADKEGNCLVFTIGDEPEKIVIRSPGAYMEFEGYFRLKSSKGGGKSEPIMRNLWKKLREAWA